MSWKNYTRLGVIFTVTGLIALGHFALTNNGHLSPHTTFIVGIVLVVVGLPLLVIGVGKRSGKV
jgi:hypothetical protein